MFIKALALAFIAAFITVIVLFVNMTFTQINTKMDCAFKTQPTIACQNR